MNLYIKPEPPPNPCEGCETLRKYYGDKHVCVYCYEPEIYEAVMAERERWKEADEDDVRAWLREKVEEYSDSKKR